jgi:hypothetical protein
MTITACTSSNSFSIRWPVYGVAADARLSNSSHSRGCKSRARRNSNTAEVTSESRPWTTAISRGLAVVIGAVCFDRGDVTTESVVEDCN